MDDMQRVYAVEKIYDYAKEYAKKSIVTARGDTYEFSSSARKLNDVLLSDGELVDYLLFAYWNGHMPADKNNGETVNGSKKRKIMQAARDAGYDEQTIRKYMRLLGYSVS